MAEKIYHNGGCVVAMRGKDCVAIATDHRFGVLSQTLSTDFKKVYTVAPRLLLGLVGLQSDILTVLDRITLRKNLYEMENHEVSAKSFTSLLSTFLYEHRFGPYYVEPVIAGLNSHTLEPFLCTMDLYGCPTKVDDFVAAGSCACQLMGMGETLWRPNLQPDQLFEVIAQTILNAFDRDALCGWGATVYVVEFDKITKRTLKTRKD
ncbi:Prosbeta3 [Drosophila busckii]|uniref:Proteasome subunit beta n=1 Tax=Drosophila busckii TaxID=30019 RepID=A0A0M3QX60_DROBS|nr:proteasome subunit beta type-3 [Drosophila busckii]ALC45299.1 Prosbeta3 [Drosophila busckii]